MTIVNRWIFALVLAFMGSSVRADESEDQVEGRLKILFSRARVLASDKVKQLKDCALPQTTAPDIKTWILANKDKLATDVTASPHVFIRTELPTCAATLLTSNAEVRFSVPTCAQTVSDDPGALKTLVHESVHHFNIGVEFFAAAVADAIEAADNSRNCPSEITALAAGSEFACALHRGNVTCWGFDGDGQTRVPRLRNPVAVKANGYHACAKDDEGLACWGLNDMNQTLVPDLGETRDFAVGAYHSCAIEEGSPASVKCWGGNWAAQRDVPASLSNPLKLALGAEHSCAVLGNGASCWGRSPQATTPSFSQLTEIAAGDNHSCAVDGGRVSCWGDNRHGQNNAPSVTGARQIAVGLYHSCVLLDGSVRCWGLNSNGQTTVPSLVEPRAIALGANFSCALDRAGVKCWGKNDQGQTDVPAQLRTLN